MTPGLSSQCQAKGPYQSLEPTPTTRIASARSPASLGLARANDMEPRAWNPPGLTAPKNGLPLAAAPRHPHPAKSALRVSSLVAYTVAGLSGMVFTSDTFALGRAVTPSA